MAISFYYQIVPNPSEICGNCKFFDPKFLDGELVGQGKGLCRAEKGLSIQRRGEGSKCGFDPSRFSPREGVVFKAPQIAQQKAPGVI